MICCVPTGNEICYAILFIHVWAFQVKIGLVNGHGRLMEPPARNSMWRFGYPNPVDYNDNELYCGGYSVQWLQNGGKCGVCGDPYNMKQPRPHEAGGEFGRGIISRHYFSGQIIDIVIELTSNHRGRFELYLCPNNNPKKEATQSCFDKYPLYIQGTREVRYLIPPNSSKKETFYYKVRLPPYLTCSQCVLQWTYYTGNMWGRCPNGTEGLGCGHPETFRNCADIRIVSSSSGLPPQFVNTITHSALSREYSMKAGPQLTYPMVVRRKKVTKKKKKKKTVENGVLGTTLATQKPKKKKMKVIKKKASETAENTSHGLQNNTIQLTSQVCVATKRYQIITGMDKWCQNNCVNFPSVCPEDFCVCPDSCFGIGNLTDIPGADEYCQDQCTVYGAKCPKERCVCY